MGFELLNGSASGGKSNFRQLVWRKKGCRSRIVPRLEGAAQQPAAMLKRLGVTLSDAEDEAFVKPVDSELDRIVKTLVDDAIREEGGQ